MTEILDGALDWASRGVPVFPCGANKAPLTTNGHKDATTDLVKVRAMFEFNSECLIGGRMGSDSGLFALDFDLYKDEDARAYMEDLQQQGALPNSQTHLTRSGGLHMLYHSDVSWPNCKPVSGVEIKGEGGYIILPPSHGYAVEHAGIVEAPSVLLALLAEAKARSAAASVDEQAELILSGRSFHDPIVAISAKLASRGKSMQDIQMAIMGYMNASLASGIHHKRHARWLGIMEGESGELVSAISSGNSKFNPDVKTERARVAGATNYDEYSRGAQDFFKDNSVGNVDPSAYEEKYTDMDWAFEGEGFNLMDELDVHDQKMILHPLLVENETVLIAGHPKAGKSALALDQAIHIACGVDVSDELKVPEARPVLYFALEGVRAVKLRIKAKLMEWEKRGIIPKQPALFVIEKSKDFFTEARQAEVVAQISAANRQAEKRYGKPLGAVYIDTLTRAMPGGNQNDATETGRFFNTVPLLRDSGLRCSYVVVHHLRKDGETRGSTNIEAEVDVIAKVSRDQETNHVSLYVDNARSIEAGAKYTFIFDNISLGETKQGYALNAPVPRPITAHEKVDASVKKAVDANTNSKFMGALLALGGGTHQMVSVGRALTKAGIIKTSADRRQPYSEDAAQGVLAMLFKTDVLNYGGKRFTISRNADNVIKSLTILVV